MLAGRSLTQFRGPLSSSVTLNPGGIFDGSCGPALTLQSGHGIPGAPHWQARGDGKQSGCEEPPRDRNRWLRAAAYLISARPDRIG
jgi:hypothetical protein